MIPREIASLPGYRATGENQYEARCPGHEDRKASLSIGVTDGKILLHCHAGCNISNILKAIGLSERDLFSDNGNGHQPEKHIVSVYDYQNADGNLVYQVVRYEPKDFRQRKPDGHGGWDWKVKDLKRVPYRLPELLTADYIYIVEGEKDAGSLRKIGLTATTIAGGAKAHWSSDIVQYFRADQHITIIPDNDPPGEDYATNAASALFGKVASLKIVRLAGLPEHADVSDWLQGRDPEAAAEELCRLSDAAPEWKPEVEKPFSLEDFALNSEVDEMEAKMLDDKFVLGTIALMGQSTAIYSKPSAGKTLLTIWMIHKGIESKNLDGSKIYYVNADDTHSGLIHKLKLANQYGYKMLSPGYRDFHADLLPLYLSKMIECDTAKGTILILDTVKKFVDLMSKERSSAFSENVRQFVLHGGTVIMLAHVNKRRDDDKKVIFAGTSDLVDDCDCAYTLDVVDDDGRTKTVMFENFKARGNVARQVVFRYDSSDSASYRKRLESIVEVGEAEREAAEHKHHVEKLLESNRAAIEAIKDCLRAGVNQKTQLIAKSVENSGCSRRHLLKALTDHTGNDVTEGQFWHISVLDKNAHVYVLNPSAF
jgi:hypothetical protein